MNLIQGSKWKIIVAIFVAIFVGATLFIFFSQKPQKQATRNKTGTETPVVLPSAEADQTPEEKRALLPPPADVDKGTWPEKIILKTPEGMNRVIVSFKYGTDKDAQREVISRYGGEVLVEFEFDPYSKSVFVPKSQRESLSKDPTVYAIEDDEPIGMIKSQVTPQGVLNMKAPDIWGKGVTGTSVKVCVIDTGVDMQNKDLTSRIFSTWSYYDNEGLTVDDQVMGHGTHVAGTIAASNDAGGVVGMAPAANLCIIRVMDDTGSGTGSSAAAGVEKAVSLGAQVINMSIGSLDSSSIEKAAVDAALAKGVLIVASSGNPDYGLGYPGKFPGVIAVTAVDNSGSKPSDFPDGSTITLAAPGIDVLSDCISSDAYCGNFNAVEKTGTKSGTSMASPHVAGALALLLSQPVSPEYDANKDGRWQPAEATKVLTDTATDAGAAGKDNRYGYGILNIQAALAAVASYSCTGTSPTDATLCPGDDTGLAANASVSVVSACTDTKKCEYTCKSGFHPEGGKCVSNPVVVPPVVAPPVITPPISSAAPVSGTSSSTGLVPCGRTGADATEAEKSPCTVCHVIVGGQRIISWGLKVMTYMAITIIVAMAVMYIVSVGDDEMMKTAKDGIKASLVGFAIMLGAWLIINTTLRLFSANIQGLSVSRGGFSFTCDTTSVVRPLP